MRFLSLPVFLGFGSVYSWGSGLLHAEYLIWIVFAYGRGLDIPNCGCWGIYLPPPLSAWTRLEDGILLMAATAFYCAAKTIAR